MDVKNAIEKLQYIELELNSFAMERTEEVKMSILALLCGQHMLLLGPPGTGKSMLVWQLVRRIDGARLFEMLLTKYSTDKDLFISRTDIQEEQHNGCKSVRFFHSTEGTLADAQVAFLDEIFKANSATLNALLTLINERKFHINGQTFAAPLVSLFGASTELPEEGEGLEALYDRFMIRMVAERVRERGNRLTMRQKSRAHRAAQANGSLPPITTINMQELDLLRKQASLVAVPTVIDERIEEIIDALLTEGIVVSDRRDARLDTIIQAHALMDGRQQVNEGDISVLQHCLWNQPTEIKTVQRIVLSIANPMENKAIELLDQAQEIRDDAVKAADGAAGAEANSKLKKLVVAIDELMRQAQSQGAPTTKIVEVKNTIQSFNKEVVKVCLGLDL